MALCSVLGHHTKALAVLDDVLALFQIDQRDLVAVGDILFCLHGTELVALAVDHILTGGNFRYTGHDIVLLIHEQCVDFHAVILLSTWVLSL